MVEQTLASIDLAIYGDQSFRFIVLKIGDDTSYTCTGTISGNDYVITRTKIADSDSAKRAERCCHE